MHNCRENKYRERTIAVKMNGRERTIVVNGNCREQKCRECLIAVKKHVVNAQLQ